MYKNSAVAEVNLKTYKHNLLIIKNVLSKNTELMVVVKANAYGHGAINIANAAYEVGVRHFGVATLEEGIELRENGVKGEILVLGHVDLTDFDLIISNNLSIAISTLEILNFLPISEKIKIHIKIDTGMSRNGFNMRHETDINDTYLKVKKLSENRNVEIKGIFTHFSSSETDENYTRKQFALFKNLLYLLKQEGVNYGKAHCASSCATLLYPETHMDMVRVGLLSYGINTTKSVIDVKPIMRVKGKLVQIKEIEEGDYVGYGNTFQAQHQMKIGIVNLGYADGVARALIDNGYFTINNAKAPLIGRISMDVSTIDLTGIQTEVDDDVIIFGDKSLGESSVSDVAAWLNTIEYEVFCNIGQRVKRIYVK